MNRKLLILLAFVLAKFVMQYAFIHSDYDLQRDEYLHLDQANHLAWGYLSVPPVTSWFAFLIKLLGGFEFWVRFFPALLGALTIVVVWKTIEELKGGLFALVLASTGLLFSALLRLNMMFQPTSFDVLCWTTFYFIVIKYINNENRKWLYAGAIIAALGMLNKYNFAFLLIGLLPALIMSPHRKVFLKRDLYIAAALAFALLVPNLLWQYNNDFPVFHHMKVLQETQLINVQRSDFLKEQILYFIGAMPVIIAGLYGLLFNHQFKRYKLFFWSLVFTLSVFLLLRAKGYYAIGLYPVYIAFGAVILEKAISGKMNIVKPILIILPILLFVPIARVVFPMDSPEAIVADPKLFKEMGLLRWEDGKEHELPQDYADMLGWKDLALQVEKICDSMPNPEQTLLLCDNYGQTGAINYYAPNNKIKAVSFNADYINWINLDKKIIDVILVKEIDDDDKERVVEQPLFDQVYLAGKSVHRYSREREISIYVLRGAKADINKRIQDEIDENKTEWKN